MPGTEHAGWTPGDTSKQLVEVMPVGNANLSADTPYRLGGASQQGLRRSDALDQLIARQGVAETLTETPREVGMAHPNLCRQIAHAHRPFRMQAQFEGSTGHRLFGSVGNRTTLGALCQPGQKLKHSSSCRSRRRAIWPSTGSANMVEDAHHPFSGHRRIATKAEMERQIENRTTGLGDRHMQEDMSTRADKMVAAVGARWRQRQIPWFDIDFPTSKTHAGGVGIDMDGKMLNSIYGWEITISHHVIASDDRR
jgi:hypothetical protein